MAVNWVKMTKDSLPFHPSVRRLYANKDGLLALEKPSGIRSHPNHTRDHKQTLIRADYDAAQERYHWIDSQGKEQFAWLLNRLDSPTSGIILIGLNEAIATSVKAQFAAHVVRKTYDAIVRNRPPKDQGIWEDLITKNGPYSSQKNQQKVPAKTAYKYIRSSQAGPRISLLELYPVTGRTHQLRKQCQKHHCPIVGDQSYGDFKFNRTLLKKSGFNRLFLHAARIQLDYSIGGSQRSVDIQSPRPNTFQSILLKRDHSEHSTQSSQELPHLRFKRP